MSAPLFGITFNDDGTGLANGRITNLDVLMDPRNPIELQKLVGESVLLMLERYEEFINSDERHVYRTTTQEPNAMLGALTILDLWFVGVVDTFRLVLGPRGIPLPMGMENGQQLGIKFQEELRARLRDINETTKGSES